MSEAKPNPNTPRVEGELSLDDLSQIAGGTSFGDLLSTGSSFNVDDTGFKPTDNMFTAVGATGSDTTYSSAAPMNLSLTFP